MSFRLAVDSVILAPQLDPFLILPEFVVALTFTIASPGMPSGRTLRVGVELLLLVMPVQRSDADPFAALAP